MTYYPKRTTIFMFIYLFFVCLMNFKELNGSRNHEQFPELGTGITSKMASAHFYHVQRKFLCPPPLLLSKVIFLTFFIGFGFNGSIFNYLFGCKFSTLHFNIYRVFLRFSLGSFFHRANPLLNSFSKHFLYIFIFVFECFEQTYVRFFFNVYICIP